GSTALQQSTSPVTLMLKTYSQSSRTLSQMGTSRPLRLATPALFTRMSTGPAAARSSAKTRSRSASVVRSPTIGTRPTADGRRRGGWSIPAGMSRNKGDGESARLRRGTSARGRNGMKPHRVGEGERSLAVFIDFENMGLGFNNRRDRFEIAKVLERLVEKGKI